MSISCIVLRILHLEFEDKHVSVASGLGLYELSRWNSASFFPSTAAKSLLNKKPDGVKVRCFAQWRQCFVTCTSLLKRLVSEDFFWINIMNFVLHSGTVIPAVGNGWYFLSLDLAILVAQQAMLIYM